MLLIETNFYYKIKFFKKKFKMQKIILRSWLKKNNKESLKNLILNFIKKDFMLI